MSKRMPRPVKLPNGLMLCTFVCESPFGSAFCGNCRLCLWRNRVEERHLKYLGYKCAIERERRVWEAVFGKPWAEIEKDVRS